MLLAVAMSFQDELCQLMPSLYSKVKLGNGSENTLDLAQYAHNDARLRETASVICLGSNTQPHSVVARQQQQLQPVRRMNPKVQQGLVPRKGTGRPVAHRAFQLEMRYHFTHRLAIKRHLLDLSHTCRLPIKSGQGDQQTSSQPTAALVTSPALEHTVVPARCTHAESQLTASPAAKPSAESLLGRLQDISNVRHSQLQQRAGSGRGVTKRTFGLALPPVHILPDPMLVSQAPEATALLTPQTAPSVATGNRASGRSKRSSRSSFGSAMEGILERPWRSVSKTPAPVGLAAPSPAFSFTPIEGVPERFEPPYPQQSTGRQRYSNKLHTPSSTRRRHAQKLQTPMAKTVQEAVLRLQSMSRDEVEPQEVSPVVGLLQRDEQQQQPPDEQQATGAEQYGSLGFFGSLCCAPPVTDAAGVLPTAWLA